MSETAEAIRAAVVRYVSAGPTALDGAELKPTRNGEAFRDEDWHVVGVEEEPADR